MTSPANPFSSIEDKAHTVDEVARIFYVTPLTVRLWITKGNSQGKRLAAMKAGKRWFISKEAMMDWANLQVQP